MPADDDMFTKNDVKTDLDGENATTVTLSGSGSLTVISEAGNGIVSKDDLVFTGGKYEINSQDHALEANDCVKITATELGITADGDGIHFENEEDASLGYVYIESGSIKIKCGGDISKGKRKQLL